MELDWTYVERAFTQLLGQEDYHYKIDELGHLNKCRIEVSLDDLRKLHPGLTDKLLNEPVKAIELLEAAVADEVRALGIMKSDTRKFRVALNGNFGRHFVSPRGLKAALANKLVKIQGIVTRMTAVRPKLRKSAHYCEATGLGSTKSYTDQLDLSSMETSVGSNAFPVKDADGNPLTTEFGDCEYSDSQILTIQEMPEKAPTGQLPRSVEISLTDDLVDRVKPGDRIEAVGVFKPMGAKAAVTAGIFRTVLIANNVYSLTSHESLPEITGADVGHIKELASRPDILDMLGSSLAPSICGHENIKKALVLLMLGGREVVLENGTHLRGDINILMVGDPSTAKSQLLRSVMNIAPLCTSTTGRGSSGVGLTAAVSFDKDTGERSLEAGAMVLADLGIVCIDEFDKMNDIDRVSIHEVMEQQTVTIAKAGIQCSLNARCSVIAAANPQEGTYRADKSPAWNISMPDSLLSRFDMLFIVLDHKKSSIDRIIAEHVIKNHSFNSVLDTMMDIESAVIQPETLDVETSESKVFMQYNDHEVITRSFMKKFIQFAKKMRPVLTPEATEYISRQWVELRNSALSDSKARVVSITVRTLETIIRISTAVAKSRLSSEVSIAHCEVACTLLKKAIFNDTDTADMDIETETAADVLTSLGSERKRKRKRVEDSEEEIAVQVSRMSISPKKLEESSRVVLAVLHEMNQGDAISKDEVFFRVSSEFQSKADFEKVLEDLNKDNKIMLMEDSQQILLI
jgi:DNA replication licensing factor MCM3